MAGDPIAFHNRYTGSTETEEVYGDGFLRWTYQSKLGRLALHALAKRALFSRWYGWRMNRPASRAKIAPFIDRYGVDTEEFADPASSFRTFNEFFYRKLKPTARPIRSGPAELCFPADGRHFGFAQAGAIDHFYVKGQRFDLAKFLASEELAKAYAEGALVFSRLCPVDYHRFHFPCAGRAGKPRLINGSLFSVNPIALRQRIAYLWENKRVLTELITERFGRVLFVEIGATCVGGIEQTFTPGQWVEKGQEKGYFRFGGSSVILLFEPGRVILAKDLAGQTAQGRELYAHMGDLMANRAD